MNRHQFTAEPRSMLGRKVKALRAKGMVPATIYGKGVKSVSIAVDEKTVAKLLDDVGETGLTDLKVGTEVRPVLVSNIHRDPVRGHLLHIEFRQVNLKEKVKANVPVELVGSAPAIDLKLGVLLTITDEIEVEALPDNLPDHIAVDVSGMETEGSEITVSQLKVPADVEVLTDKEQVVVKIAPLTKEEAPAPVAVPVEGEAAPAAEGEATPESATKAEEAKE